VLALPGLDARQPDVLKVLFIGNSLTAANSMPSMVQGLARAAGGATVAATTLTVNNFSLEDHWNGGDARKIIVRGGWSVIVLQQGPSALPDSRVLLRDYTKRFDRESKKIGAKTALYMVWPSKNRFGDFDDVSRSYALAAADVGGLLLPAGDAWRAAWRRDAALPLYARDDFHPSVMGSYLAALVIYQGLSGRSPVGLPGPEEVGPAARRLLQESASEAGAAPRGGLFSALGGEFAGLR
jgi:hypothetical protein